MTGTNRSLYVHHGTDNFRFHCGGGLGFFDLSKSNGTFQFRNNITTLIATIGSNGVYTASDDRLKTDESFIENALQTVLKIKPEIYTKFGQRESGVIAQQLWYEVPELRHLVLTDATPDENISIGDDPNQDPDYSSWGGTAQVNYIQLIPYLISAIHELDAAFKSLQKNV